MPPGCAASASLYAAVRASSAKALMSPCRSRTATSGAWRTSASNWTAMRLSFQVHDQLDRVPGIVVRDIHLIHHVLDEEEAPAARTLQAGELGIQIGDLGVLGNVRLTLVGDANDEIIGRVQHLDGDRHVLLVMVAVLHGVHGRLGNAVHHDPLVAGYTRHRECRQGIAIAHLSLTLRL